MLAAALALPFLSLALLVVTPAVLTRGQWQVHFPRLALRIWFAALAAGCAAMLGSVAMATAGAVTPSPGASPVEVTLTVVIAWLGLAALGAAAAHVLGSAEPLATAAGHTPTLTAAVASSREPHPGFTLIRVQTNDPVVCAVAGAEPAIWLSSGAERLLTRDQLRAVLAHEYAHLRGRHHWARRIAALNARCLPRTLAAGPALQRATALLVELIADDAAARQAGPAELANALAILSRATAAPGMELRAERLTRRRWPGPSRRRLPRALRLAA